MITSSLIRISQNAVERTFVDLQKEIANYERLQNNIQNNLDRLRNIKYNKRIDIYSPQGLELVLTLKEANTDMREICYRSLREIDSMSAVIAGYLSILIEECIDTYSPRLKIWIRDHLTQLVELREIKVNGVSSYLMFPLAVSVLTPYIIRTRMCAEETSDRLISIRRLIRTLSEPSY